MPGEREVEARERERWESVPAKREDARAQRASHEPNATQQRALEQLGVAEMAAQTHLRMAAPDRCVDGKIAVRIALRA